MRYAVIDPANKAGVAIIQDGKLSYTCVARKIGTKGRWTVETKGKDADQYSNQYQAFCDIIDNVDGVIIEEGFGRFATAIKSQAGYRDYIRCICDMFTAKGEPKTFKVVNVSEWRRVIKEAYGVSWPVKSVAKKALSVQLVKREFGIDVSDDEADAVLLFVASKRMGYIL
jgi:hypothetical protein